MTYVFQSATHIQPGDRLLGPVVDWEVATVEANELLTRLHCTDGVTLIVLSRDRVFVACDEREKQQ